MRCFVRRAARRCFSQVDDMRAQVMSALQRHARHPETGDDIVQSGQLKNLQVNKSGVRLELEPDRHFRTLQKACVAALKDLGVPVEVDMAEVEKVKNQRQEDAQSLKDIKHIVAVSSCKGGVGKSTVSLNLAVSLAQRGLRVGLFDADIYGPSAPTLVAGGIGRIRAADHTGYIDVRANEVELRVDETTKLVSPPEFFGVKIMSYGWLSDQQQRASAASSAGAAMVRGPIASGMATQLLRDTDWGELDVLLVDLPPGTGDIQISLCQQVAFDGAVVVTTPHRLARVDVVKGVEMLDRVNVPTLALVENFSELRCHSCGTVHRPFGESCLSTLGNMFGLCTDAHKHESLRGGACVSLPLSEQVAHLSDRGIPAVHTEASDTESTKEAFSHLASALLGELEAGNYQAPAISFDTSRSMIILQSDQYQEMGVPTKKLRQACRCAHCVDEWTGEVKQLSVDDAAAHRPVSLEQRGRYALEVRWQDGHVSIYPFAQLATLAAGHVAPA